jgi:hypothetical protein
VTVVRGVTPRRATVGRGAVGAGVGGGAGGAVGAVVTSVGGGGGAVVDDGAATTTVRALASGVNEAPRPLTRTVTATINSSTATIPTSRLFTGGSLARATAMAVSSQAVIEVEVIERSEA